MAVARHLFPIAINAEDAWLFREVPGHDHLVIRLGKDCVPEAAGQIEFGFSPSHDERAWQLVFGLGR